MFWPSAAAFQSSIVCALVNRLRTEGWISRVLDVREFPHGQILLEKLH
jgi:hypothetical protein